MIRKSFELIEIGHDHPAEILRGMTDMGLRSKDGNKLTAHTFVSMLRNPVYIGQMQSKKWGTLKGLHVPIVSEHTFRNVQLILKGKKPTAAPYQLNRPGFPLRGFLRCSECDRPLAGGPSRSHTGKTYDYYHCYKCRAVKSLPTDKAASGFLELLKRLRVDESFTTEFSGILEREWNEKTGDSTAMVRKLNGELKEKRAAQQNLLMKYVNDDPKIMPYFESMNRKFEDEISTLEAHIAEADMVKATFAQLWEFSKSLLVDIGAAWEKANIDQKQRVQNILFSGGLKYHPENGILNPDNECLFNQLENFLGGNMCVVRPTRFELVT